MLVFKKEKQVVELIRQHIDTSGDCLKKARATLEALVSGDEAGLKVSVAEVERLETLADDQKRQIRDVLYSGAFLPEIRAEIYRLVDRVDDIADIAEAATDFIANQRPIIPEEFQSEFVEIYSISVASFLEFRRAMKTFLKPKGKFEKLQERANRVGRLETEVDEFQSRVTQKIFASELEYAHKIHLVRLLDIVSGIADRTENAADELMFTALKSAI